MTPSERDAVARTVRALCGGFEAAAVALAADLLNTIEAAGAVLAPVADHTSEAGIAAGVAFQMLADAAAGAVPLKSEAK